MEGVKVRRIGGLRHDSPLPFFERTSQEDCKSLVFCRSEASFPRGDTRRKSTEANRKGRGERVADQLGRCRVLTCRYCSSGKKGRASANAVTG